MGAWGTQPFENDDALDFVGSLNAGNQKTSIESVLGIDADDLIESDEGAIVIALGQLLVNRLEGETAENIPALDITKDEAMSYLVRLRPLLDAVLSDEENSELLELWDGNEEWLASVKKIQDAADRLLPEG